MATHSHTATANTTGNHTHYSGLCNDTTNFGVYGNASLGKGSAKLGIGSGTAGTYQMITSSAGNHSHTVTVNNTGENTAHNNLPPFISIYIFRRTA